MPRIVAIYPGRFQPMGRHHYNSYLDLVDQFGKNNVYVVTSGKVEPGRSPLTFAEKRKVAVAHGIPSNRFIQVKNPYKAEELTATFPEDTSVVFAVGDKDMREDPRFRTGMLKSGKSSYFQPLKGHENNLKGYQEHGYLYVLPHVSIAIPGYGEMSGTELRNVLATASPKQFKQIMGWYDSGIANMLADKFSVRESIMEGGAAGHLNHPFDKNDLTFGDMKEMIRRALAGELNIEKDVVEKTDGQNLQITFKDGQVLAARNKTQIKDPISADDIKMKFAGRGSIERAFGFAMDDLESALNRLPKRELDEIFQNGKRFMNLEIIFPETKNIINYGADAYLQFHGLVEYDETGKVVDTYPEYGKKLQRMIAKVNADTQKQFKIIPPKVVQIEKSKSFDERLPYYLNKIDKLQKVYGLTDNDEVIEWSDKWWDDYIDKNYPDISQESKEALISRWSRGDRSFRLDKNITSDTDELNDMKQVDKEFAENQMKRNVGQFEDIFLELGAEVLSNISDVLSAVPNDAVKEMRKGIADTIKQIQASGDIAILDKLRDQLKRINKLGGLDKLVPLEGIVFTYKGDTYKLTGAFAPANQILGMLKYIR